MGNVCVGLSSKTQKSEKYVVHILYDQRNIGYSENNIQCSLFREFV